MKKADLKPKKTAKRITKKSKIGISIRLDAEIIEWAMVESDKLNIPYQTFLRNVLIGVMKGEGSGSSPDRKELRKEIRSIVREELKKIS